MTQLAREISGKSTLIGLVGHGISYTKSPLIHNFSAQLLGQDDLYVPFDIPAHGVEPLMDALWQMGCKGFNVTTPHKELVSKLLGGSEGQSVNTVYRGSSGWETTSTDGEGLAAAVQQLGVSFKSFRRFVILGNGGVVSAILDYLAHAFETMPEVIILRRDSRRDEPIRYRLPKAFRISFDEIRPEILSHLLKGGSGDTLLVQATSAPHLGDDLARFAVALQHFNGVFVDLVYGAPSALLTTALGQGIPCQDGLPMLIEQARASQRYWWNDSASFDAIHQALTGQLPNRRDD